MAETSLSDTLASPRSRTFTGGLRSLLCDLIFAIVLGLSAATLFAREAWLEDMISFFRPHLAVGALLLVPLAVLMRSRVRLVLALALCIFNLWPLMVRSHAAPAPAEGDTIRVLSANLLGDSTDYPRFFAMVKETAPDVLVVQEAKPNWRAALGALASDYPYRASTMVKEMSTVDVLSRRSFSARFIEGLPTPVGEIGGGRPIRVELEPERPGARPLVIYAIHPPTPRTKRGWVARNAYLDTIARAMHQESEQTPVVVAGDWNTPTWSPFFDEFLAATGTASADGASWPAPTRVFKEFDAPSWLGSPVDHIAVNRGVGVAHFSLGPATGSDHLPIYADVAVRPES